MDRSAKLGIALVSLFAMPFAGFGLYALSTALKQLATGGGDSSVALPLLFGFVFSGIGFGLIAVMIIGRKRVLRQQSLQSEHPTEPWLWRQDWAAGRVNSKTRTGMLGYWAVAVMWNAISAPLIFSFRHAFSQKGSIVFLALIFPCAGVYLLICAIRQTIAYFEFGQSVFEMSSIPGVLGGHLKGTIQARFPRSADHGAQLRLSCVRHITTGTGNSRSTSEIILWRDEKSLLSGELYSGPAATLIPVDFRIPWDAQATETRCPQDGTFWMLEALADVPGVDYHDIFEVPVFRTSQTPTQPPPDGFSMETISTPTRPNTMTIEVAQSSAGTEFYFPAARNKGFAGGATAFCLVFSLITFFLAGHAPFIFPLAFGFFSLLLFYISAQMWLATTRVTIGNGTLDLQSGWMGGGKHRQISCADIASIGDRITAQQGGGTGTPYYDIELTRRAGGKLTLGRTLRSKQETDWLVQEMRRLTGVQPKSMTASA